MKRETFEIKLNGVLTGSRSKWNAAIRSIEAAVRDSAGMSGTIYTLVDSHSETEGSYHVRGHRTWKCNTTGDLLKFEIRKVS